MGYTTILANGLFPKTNEVKRFFYNADRLICCDGSTKVACLNGREPDFIVGDCDSISTEITLRFQDRLIHLAEQNSNDLAKAFRFCIANGWRDIVILGATGKREDHTLGNISYLLDFVQYTEKIKMFSDYGVFLIVRHSGFFRATPKQQISIFSLDPTQRISSKGLKYPLNKLMLPYWYTATLNESLGDYFGLEFDEKAPLLLFFANEIKKSPK